jgi:D-serine deaminase-like pyridoxal phosphate-dependent protein
MGGIEIEGLFTHEGHIYKAEAADRATLCSAAAEKLRRVRDQISDGGGFQISVGSTPSLQWMTGEEGVTELRPGVFVFGDVMQTRLGMDAEDCALTVLATVVSRPEAQTAILDSGSKTLSGDHDPYGWKYGLIPDHPDALLDWVSEEHGHVDLSGTTWNPRVGDKVRIIPYHACAATNMHDELYAVRGESVEDVWKVAARGKIR